MTYLLSSKNIWKSSGGSAIIIVISYAEIGAREAGRGHEMVLLAAPLRLYWYCVDGKGRNQWKWELAALFLRPLIEIERMMCKRNIVV